MTAWEPVGQAKQKYYREILMKLRKNKKKEKIGFVWILHKTVKKYLANRRILVFEHPPYSPDLASCNFHLIPKVKSVLRESECQSVEEVKAQNGIEFEEWKSSL